MITDSDHLHHPAWVPSLLSGQTTSPHRLASSDDIRPVDRPIGISDAWHDVLKRSSQVAATEAPTCLQGESGTGKEVIARFIHRLSPRRRGPFVAIELRAVPEQLLESELFGSSAVRLPARTNQNPARSNWRREACCSSTKLPR
jgi:DNA-binding NtrC family response regulator